MSDGQDEYEMKRLERLAKQYEHILDLYKLHWNMILKISGFYIVSVGSLLSFYATHSSDKNANYIVVFCAIYSLIYVLLANHNHKYAKELGDAFEGLGHYENLDFDYHAEAYPLYVFCKLNAVLGFLIGLSCSCIYGDWWLFSCLFSCVYLMTGMILYFYVENFIGFEVRREIQHKVGGLKGRTSLFVNSSLLAFLRPPTPQEED